MYAVALPVRQPPIMPGLLGNAPPKPATYFIHSGLKLYLHGGGHVLSWRRLVACGLCRRLTSKPRAGSLHRDSRT